MATAAAAAAAATKNFEQNEIKRLLLSHVKDFFDSLHDFLDLSRIKLSDYTYEYSKEIGTTVYAAVEQAIRDDTAAHPGLQPNMLSLLSKYNIQHYCDKSPNSAIFSKILEGMAADLALPLATVSDRSLHVPYDHIHYDTSQVDATARAIFTAIKNKINARARVNQGPIYLVYDNAFKKEIVEKVCALSNEMIQIKVHRSLTNVFDSGSGMDCLNPANCEYKNDEFIHSNNKGLLYGYESFRIHPHPSTNTRAHVRLEEHIISLTRVFKDAARTSMTMTLDKMNRDVQYLGRIVQYAIMTSNKRKYNKNKLRSSEKALVESHGILGDVVHRNGNLVVKGSAKDVINQACDLKRCGDGFPIQECKNMLLSSGSSAYYIGLTSDINNADGFRIAGMPVMLLKTQNRESFVTFYDEADDLKMINRDPSQLAAIQQQELSRLLTLAKGIVEQAIALEGKIRTGQFDGVIATNNEIVQWLDELRLNPNQICMNVIDDIYNLLNRMDSRVGTKGRSKLFTNGLLAFIQTTTRSRFDALLTKLATESISNQLHYLKTYIMQIFIYCGASASPDIHTASDWLKAQSKANQATAAAHLAANVANIIKTHTDFKGYFKFEHLFSVRTRAAAEPFHPSKNLDEWRGKAVRDYDKTYEIEHIFGKRLIGFKHEYLVKWKDWGYNSSETTWQSPESIAVWANSQNLAAIYDGTKTLLSNIQTGEIEIAFNVASLRDDIEFNQSTMRNRVFQNQLGRMARFCNYARSAEIKAIFDELINVIPQFWPAEIPRDVSLSLEGMKPIVKEVAITGVKVGKLAKIKTLTPSVKSKNATAVASKATKTAVALKRSKSAVASTRTKSAVASTRIKQPPRRVVSDKNRRIGGGQQIQDVIFDLKMLFYHAYINPRIASDDDIALMYIYYNLLSKQLVTVPPKRALDMNGAGVYVQTAAIIDRERGTNIESVVREAIMAAALHSPRSRVISTTYHSASTAALKALRVHCGLSYTELAHFICRAIVHEGPIKGAIYDEITNFIRKGGRFTYFNWGSHKTLYPVCATSKFEIEKFNELLEIPDILGDFETHKEMLAWQLLPYYGDLKYAFETGIINKAYTINVLAPEIRKPRLSPIVEESAHKLANSWSNKHIAPFMPPMPKHMVSSAKAAGGKKVKMNT